MKQMVYENKKPTPGQLVHIMIDFRGDQDNLRIFYGITSVYQGGFSQSSTGYR